MSRVHLAAGCKAAQQHLDTGALQDPGVVQPQRMLQQPPAHLSGVGLHHGGRRGEDDADALLQRRGGHVSLPLPTPPPPGEDLIVDRPQGHEPEGNLGGQLNRMGVKGRAKPRVLQQTEQGARDLVLPEDGLHDVQQTAQTGGGDLGEVDAADGPAERAGEVIGGGHLGEGLQKT